MHRSHPIASYMLCWGFGTKILFCHTGWRVRKKSVPGTLLATSVARFVSLVVPRGLDIVSLGRARVERRSLQHFCTNTIFPCIPSAGSAYTCVTQCVLTSGVSHVGAFHIHNALVLDKSSLRRLFLCYTCLRSIYYIQQVYVVVCMLFKCRCPTSEPTSAAASNTRGRHAALTVSSAPCRVTSGTCR